MSSEEVLAVLRDEADGACKQMQAALITSDPDPRELIRLDINFSHAIARLISCSIAVERERSRNGPT